jgi:peptide/nickel transport system ATP-binding protein
LEVKDLAIAYRTRKRDVPAVRGVNFAVHRGETIGLVGESGCGKSTIAFGILDFLGSNGRVVAGSIKFNGIELVGRPKKELRKIRGNQISMVYQNPMQALNPSVTIGRQLTEVLTTHHHLSRRDALNRSIGMLERVFMPDAESVMKRYPHMLSGGQQQRVVIAMAMLNNPALLIMDEPTTALDVTVEAVVLDLVEDLKKEFETGIIFITHNLGVVARISDRLCVMYAGEMVEKGTVTDLFYRPAHPYTRGLLCCVPRVNDDLSYSQLWSIEGNVPHPADRNPKACIYLSRCDWFKNKSKTEPHLVEQCSRAHPQLVEVGTDHQSRCFLGDKTLQVPWNDYYRGNKRRLETEHEQNGSRFGEELMRADNLKIYYRQRSGSLIDLLKRNGPAYVKAVDGISFTLDRGSTLGIVGESGCGKSTLAKGIIGLENLVDGNLKLMGIDISYPVAKRSPELIKELQMVFQNPDSTLNPSYPVGKQIARPLRKLKTVARSKTREQVEQLLEAVNLDSYYYDRLPHQLSGGEKQRVGIARALASRPSMIICDEPVSALDVSVQAAVLNLLNRIKEEFQSTLIFIAHDLSVVRFISDFIVVMYLGKIVESGSVAQVYPPPYHPYTEALLSAIPAPDPRDQRKRIRLSGEVPSALNPPAGCPFHTRCQHKASLPDHGKLCETKDPPRQTVSKNHTIACHIPPDHLMRLQK